MSNPLNINVFGTNYENIEGICVSGTDNNNTYTYIVPTGTITIEENGNIDITEYAAAQVSVMPASLRYQSKTITPSTSIITVTPDAEYDALETVTVAAIPSGIAGTPIANKGTVSNHIITITPTVTNTTGYIVGGTKYGTNISVSAAELVSGVKTISSSGNNIDVISYATVSVPTGTINTPTIVSNSIANASITLTPKVVVTAGYINSGTVTGSSMTIYATQLVSGSRTITSNGNNINVATLASVNVNVAGGGSSTTPNLQQKSATPSISQITVMPDNGYDGLASVTIAAIPSQYIIPTGTKNINSNGTNIDVKEYARINVSVAGSSIDYQDGDILLYGEPPSSIVGVAKVGNAYVGTEE